MNIRKKTLNALSTAFLAISLIIAGGIATDTLNPRDAEANASVQNDLEIETMGPACVGPPVNCFEPIVITPEEK
jgi:hypothetical protein